MELDSPVASVRYGNFNDNAARDDAAGDDNTFSFYPRDAMLARVKTEGSLRQRRVRPSV